MAHDSYADLSELEGIEENNFNKLKKHKKEYLGHMRTRLASRWDSLPKKGYISRYRSRVNPSYRLLLQSEHAFFIQRLKRTEQFFQDGRLIVNEEHLVFVRDSYCRIDVYEEHLSGNGMSRFRIHRLSDKRLVTFLKEDSDFAAFVDRMSVFDGFDS